MISELRFCDILINEGNKIKAEIYTQNHLIPALRQLKNRQLDFDSCMKNIFSIIENPKNLSWKNIFKTNYNLIFSILENYFKSVIDQNPYYTLELLKNNTKDSHFIKTKGKVNFIVNY